MAVSIARANAMLGGMLGTSWVQVHNGDPGPNGTANVVVGPGRAQVVLPAASGGVRALLTPVDVPNVPQGAAVSHVSYWDAQNGGTFDHGEPLGVTVTFAYAGTLRFLTQTFTIGTESGGSQTQTSVTPDTVSQSDANVARLTVRVIDAASQTDSAGAFLGAGASDATSQTDAVAIGQRVVVVDATAQSDSATVGGGAVSNVTDTTSQSDSNTAQVQGAGATLTRASTGLLYYDDFPGTSLAAGWSAAHGTTSVSGGSLHLNNDGSAAGGSAGESAIRRAISLPGNGRKCYAAIRYTTNQYEAVAILVGDGTDLSRVTKYRWLHAGEWDNGEGDSGPGGTDIHRFNAGSETPISTPVYNTVEGANLVLAGFMDTGSFALYQGGAQRQTATDNTHTSFPYVYLSGNHGYAGGATDIDCFVICTDRAITCSGLPTGYKLRVGGASGLVATESGGTATVNCGGRLFPASLNSGWTDTVEVLNAADAVQATFTSANDVWGGDAFTYTA